MPLTVTVAAQICQKDSFQLPLPLQLVLASMITAKELTSDQCFLSELARKIRLASLRVNVDLLEMKLNDFSFDWY